MSHSELKSNNLKRISIINWLLILPLMVLFAWPFFYIAQFLNISTNISYAGAFFFALPFTITILHGHVTMALGELHRHHYYSWLQNRPYSYGLLFHPLLKRTRFRLFLLMASLILLITGYFVT
jgi:hypothetical protein